MLFVDRQACRSWGKYLQSLREIRELTFGTGRLAVLSMTILVATPLLMLPDGLFRFVLPKITFLFLVVFFAFLAPSSARLGRPATLTLVSLPVLFVVAALFSESPLAALLGRWPRYEGLPVLLLYVGLILVGSRILGGPTAGQNRRLLINGLSVIMFVLAPIAVAEAAGLRPLGGGEDVRPGATLGNATDLGLVGLVTCLLLLPSALWTKNRVVQLGAVAAGVVTVASGSRACILVLVFVGIFILGFRAYGQARAGKPILAVATVLGFFGAAAVVIWSIPSVAERLLSQETVTGRVYLWEASLKALQGNFLGIGGSQFVDALPLNLTDEFAKNVGTEFPADSPHMLPLQLLSAGGILLLLAVGVFIFMVIANGTNRIRTTAVSELRLFLFGALAAVCGYGFALMTHFTSPGTVALVCVLAGAILATAPVQEKAAAGRRTTVPAPVRFSVAGLALVGAILSGVAASAELPMKSGTDLSARGNIQQATKAFEAAKALRPWDQDVDLLAAQAFAVRAVQGDSPAADAAVTWASAAVERNRSSMEALSALAIGQLGTGDVEAAEKTLDRQIDRSPWTSEPYLLRGLAKANGQDMAGAIADVESAAALTPKPKRALSILSELYVVSGQPEKAAEVEEKQARVR